MTAPHRNQTNNVVLLLIPVVTLGQLSMDMYLPAIKSLQAGLHASDSQVQLTLSIFVVCLGLSQLVTGEIARRLGRGLAIKIALICFACASAGCVVTPTIGFFIVCRAVQGVATAVCVALSYAVISDHAEDGHESMRGMTVLAAFSTVSPVVAPVIGSQALQLTGSWRSLFMITLALSSAAILMVFIQPRGRFDTRSTPPSGAVGQAYAAIVRSPSFWRYALLCSIGTTINFCFFSFLPAILLVQHGFTQNEFSASFCLCALAEIAGALVAPKLNKAVGNAGLIGLACAFCALGGVGVAWFSARSPAFMIASFALVQLGTGMLIAPCFSSAIYPFRATSNEASAMCGLQQFLIAAGVATLAAALHWQSGYALGMLIAAAALGAAIIYCVLRGNEIPETPEAPALDVIDKTASHPTP